MQRREDEVPVDIETRIEDLERRVATLATAVQTPDQDYFTPPTIGTTLEHSLDLFWI